MKRAGYFFGLVVAVLFFVGAVSSFVEAIDYIAYVGSEVDLGTASGWLTEDVAKPLSADGDNTYATLGGMNWGAYTQGAAAYINSVHVGYHVDELKDNLFFNTSGNQYNHSSYATIDNLKTPSAKTSSGIVVSDHGGYTLYFNEDYDRVRIGVMWDMLGTGTPAEADRGNQAIYVTNNFGGGAIPGYLTSGNIVTATENNNPDIYFYDLVNVKVGDKFSVISLRGGGDTGMTHSAYLGPLMVDLAPATGANTGRWTVNLSDTSAVNYLDTTRVNPAIALKDSDGAMSSATARLQGTAGNYTSIGLAGLAPWSLAEVLFNSPDVPQMFAFAGSSGTAEIALSAATINSISDFTFEQSRAPIKYFSVDIQGEAATHFDTPVGTADNITGLGDHWNMYNTSTWTTTSDPAPMALVDSEGNASTITFDVTKEAASYNTGNATNTMLSEYLLSNTSGFKQQISWEISGLNPDELYRLLMLPSYGRGGEFTVLDALLAETEYAAANTFADFMVYADAAGKISGYFGTTTPGAEMNWSAFHLLAYGDVQPTVTPEPGTWAMMLMAMAGVGILLRRRRKTA